MAPKVDNDKGLRAMRAVLGSGPSDMDLIRCLHLARNDVARAINILLDTPGFNTMGTTKKSTEITCNAVSGYDTQPQLDMQCLNGTQRPDSERVGYDTSTGEKPSITNDFNQHGDLQPFSSSNRRHSKSVLSTNEDSFSNVTEADLTHSNKFEPSAKPHSMEKDDWLYLGETDVIGFSTCKGHTLEQGEKVLFTFPKIVSNNAKSVARGRGKSSAVNSEIVRFSSKNLVEVQSFVIVSHSVFISTAG
jgi:DNA repair protein RAD5